jgi:N-acetylmuramoyl-L-alanine amidase
VRKIEKIIIHVSDSPDSMDIGFSEINQWHKERQFTPYDKTIYCGYNYIIRKDGTIENPRPDEIPGIHCSGHNKDSIGICWVGRSIIADQQMESLIFLCHSLMDTYGLDLNSVFGHSHFNKGKTCPNIDIEELKEHLKR